MNRPRIVAVIPARMASTRFPGKPLEKIAGLPMVEHVRRRTLLCPLVDEAIVATCDESIAAATAAFGGRAVMTLPTHERCTDRVAEAARQVEADIIINIQGDEPFLRPDMLSVLVRPMLEDPALECTNLIAEISEGDAPNPNLVKVVCDAQMFALYFSREAIPSRKKSGLLPIRWFKQLGIIAFRKNFLEMFNRLPPTPLEALESVDMLRLIEHGHRIKMIPTSDVGIGVDTPADLAMAQKLMEGDLFLPSYHTPGS